MKRLSLLAMAAVVLFTGCSPHSLIFKNTYQVIPEPGISLPPYEGKVFITTEKLPASVEARNVGIIRVGKVYYDSSEWAMQAFAVKARQAGANAVVEARTWQQPSAWAWSTPHGTGRAVRVKDPKALEAANLKGTWY